MYVHCACVRVHVVCVCVRMRACVCVCVSQPALAAANALACACRHDRALWAQSQRHPRPRRKAASAYFTASSGARLRAWRRTSTTTTFFVKFLMRGGLFLRPEVVLALVDRRIVKKSVWPGSEPPTGHLGKGAREFVVIVVSVGPSAEPQPRAANNKISVETERYFRVWSRKS